MPGVDRTRPLAALAGAWDRFWFAPRPVATLGAFRVLFGGFILLILVISYPSWDAFYGPAGYLSFDALAEPYTGYSWSLFALSEQPALTWAIFWLGALAAVAFTAGFWTRSATIALFLVFLSMLHRNPYLTNGQDQVATMLLFLSCFAPLGLSMSMDEIMARRRLAGLATGSAVPTVQPLWSWRLMQVSIALIYLFAAPTKYLDDTAWRDGTAIYYLSLSDRWFRFPDAGIFHADAVSVALTFGSLVIELAFPLLVWFSRTRPIMIVAVTGFHLIMMVVMSVGVFFFNLLMLVSFVLFVQPQTIERLVRLVRPERLREDVGWVRMRRA